MVVALLVAAARLKSKEVVHGDSEVEGGDASGLVVDTSEVVRPVKISDCVQNSARVREKIETQRVGVIAHHHSAITLMHIHNQCQ